jgi:hypothetical protein
MRHLTRLSAALIPISALALAIALSGALELRSTGAQAGDPVSVCGDGFCALDPGPESPDNCPQDCAPVLDHFQCYDIHRPATGEDVTLADRFGPSNVRVIRPRRICAPASKNGENPGAPQADDHLTAYKIRQTSPRFERELDQLVVNQFGELRVDLVRPEQLLVPTGKSLGSDPLPAYVAGIDHFKCYRAKRPNFREFAIQIEDQFGMLTLDIKRPMRFCAAANKNGEGVNDLSSGLMCYRTRTRQRPIRGTINTTNQFADDIGFQFFGPRELCVPSQLNPTEATATPITTATPVFTQTDATPTTTPTPVFTQTDATPTLTPTDVPS